MSGELLWYVSRAGGVVAFGLLSLSVVLGLIASLRLSTPRWPRAVTTELHQFVTVTALAFTALHVVTIVAHPTEGFSIAAALIPFAGTRDTLATGLGVLAMEAAVAVWLSTYVRGRIGYRNWRRLHHLAFASFGFALAHGLMQGTDTATAWGRGVYMVAAAAVGGLVALRVLRPREATSGDTPADPRGRAAGHAALPPLRQGHGGPL